MFQGSMLVLCCLWQSKAQQKGRQGAAYTFEGSEGVQAGSTDYTHFPGPSEIRKLDKAKPDLNFNI